MYDADHENTQRWRAWRIACEHGGDWAEAYDRYLHPDTRVGLDQLAAEFRHSELAVPAGLRV